MQGVPIQPPIFFKNPAVATILSFFLSGLGGLDHGVGHFRPLSITRQRHLLVYHYIAMSHEGLCQVF